MKVSILLIICCFPYFLQCARILCIASLPTFSHNFVFRHVWKALADRGHELTVLTANPMKNSYRNIKEIDLNYVYERKTILANFNWAKASKHDILKIYDGMFQDITIMELSHPEVQTLLHNKTEYFDLVVAEMHIPTMFLFAHRFNCSLIGISSTDTIQHSLLGNPTHPHFDAFSEASHQTIQNRFWNVYSWIFGSQMFKLGVDKEKEYFGEDAPTPEEMTRNMKFALLNIHPLLYTKRLSSKTIPIGGGLHITNPQPLPQGLESFLNNSSQGVVYFSLGTNIHPSQYPPNFTKTILDACQELPYQFLWRTTLEINNLPKNVKVYKWVPQQDLLRHPGIKAFVTQAGLHSLEESIDATVPVVAIPFMSDQFKNVRNIEAWNFGIVLNKDNLTKETFQEAIRAVVENPSYKQNLHKLSKYQKDLPMSGLEKAVWYIEYAIRHPDSNLYGTVPDIPLYQYLFLDFIFVFTILLCIVSYVLYKMVQKDSIIKVK